MVCLPETDSAGELNLHPCAAAATVTDVARMDGPVSMASEARLDAGRRDGCADARLQSRVESTEQCLWRVSAATMYGDDVIAARQESETFRFIEAMTRQVQRRVTPRLAQPFEEIEVELRAGDGARNLGGTRLDGAAVGREDGNLGGGPALDANLKIRPFHLGYSQICIALVSSVEAAHGDQRVYTFNCDAGILRRRARRYQRRSREH
jgi:hypothetical protein